MVSHPNGSHQQSSRAAGYYYYYYYAAFNAPCVGHKDDESQAQYTLKRVS